MQGNVVSAARWLGGSILLASIILVVGLRGLHPIESRTVRPILAMVNPAETEKPPKADAVVVQASGEKMTEEPSDSDQQTTQCFSRESVDRVPILDPIPGETTTSTCLDPPSEAEVWEKVGKIKSDSPTVETQRNNVRIVTEKIGEKVDPCKVYPLAGPCELVHCHYKCTVSFDEQSWTDSPVRYSKKKQRVEVVYIDKDHLRRCSGPVESRPAP
jgi:hypothetical protein